MSGVLHFNYQKLWYDCFRKGSYQIVSISDWGVCLEELAWIHDQYRVSGFLFTRGSVPS